MALRDPTRPVEERPVHPRAPRPKQRTVRGYRVPPRDRRHGLVVLHTGDGKGKTTAALGILLRATGREMKVAMPQFIKTYPLAYGWLTHEDVFEALQRRPPGTHVVITGRLATPELIGFADLVTEMREVKHPYRERGLGAQPGIEL